MQNVLFLMADQFRYDAARFTGNPIVQTPYLDKFAASATVFSHAFTPTPICVAARMSLITGQRGSRTRYLDNRRLPGAEPMWPTMMTLLHEAGYWTQAVGKMHFSGRHYGFQRIVSQEETPGCIADDDYLLYLKENGQSSRFPHGHRDLLYYQPQKSTVALEHSPENWVAEQSIRFLREHVRYRKQRPFFLFSSWIAPHPPFAACEPYASLYKPENIPLPLYSDRSIEDLPPAARGHRARLDGAHRDAERMRRIKSLYYGKVTHVDDCIGQVLNELERLGLHENTIVIFMSDHGEMLGDHGLSQKNVPYEPSVRIPLIVRWKGLTEPDTVRDNFVGLEDIMPTLIHHLNLEYPPSFGELPGYDLFSDAARDDYIADYGSGMSRWISVRTKRYKYNYWLCGPVAELFDLIADPGEQNNLLHQLPETAEAMHRQAVEWERDHGLPDSLDQEDFITFPATSAIAEEACRDVTINGGKWAENLPVEEEGLVDSFSVSFSHAIDGETTLNPEKLSIDLYKAKGGDLRGTPWEPIWETTKIR